jgi:NAD+ kinase
MLDTNEKFIALFPNLAKKPSKNLAIGIREFFQSHGYTVAAEDEEADIIGALPFSKIRHKEIQLMISMGGDGSILRLVHKYPDMTVPILGINLGHLGFMADVPIADLYPSLQDLVAGLYQVEERLMIQGKRPTGEPFFAVNDIVIHRANNPSLIEMAIHVGGVYVNTFVADGLIIATPNGSTAYSLSAGGPIISPALEALAITPVSPHTISNRPLVLAADQDIQIQYLTEEHSAEISADGLKGFEINAGQAVHIGKCPRRFKLVSLHRRDYFSTLRTKLGWSGKVRL